MLQADSEKLRQAWVQAVQASIASAYRESPDSCYSEVGPRRLRHACARPLRLRASVCGPCRRAHACGCLWMCECVCLHTCLHRPCFGVLRWHLCPGRRRGPAGGGEAGAPEGLSGPSPSPEAGSHGVPVHKQHRLRHGLAGARRQGRERASARAGCGWQRPVWRLWPAGPPLGQHQPGRAALHRVLGHPQVGPRAGGRGARLSQPRSPLPPPSRSLGVHCSKVRSLTLDSWEPELLKVCVGPLQASRRWRGVWKGLVLRNGGI